MAASSKWILGIAVGAIAWPTLAQENSGPPAKPAESKPAAVADAPKIDAPKIDELIKQLDADDFTARQDASARLGAAGETAIPALEKAISSDSRETSMRAFDLLKGHFEKGSPNLKELARQALDRIAKADLGPASKSATEVLNPPAPTPPMNTINGARGFGRAVPLPAGAVPGIRIAGARVMIAGAAVGGATETKIKIEDGVTTTEVKDKDRQVKIVDNPDKGLELEVTEKKDGKETTEKFAAKNVEELKTKHPEAHKIYEKYAKGGAEFKIAGFGAVPGGAIPLIPVAPAPLPVPFIPPPIAPAPPMRAVPEEGPAPAPAARLDRFEGLKKAIEEMEANLKEAAKQGGDTEQLKKAQARLDEVRKQLEKLQAAEK